MIETAELRLELLRIVKDKNGCEVDEIIHSADKLFNWVNYTYEIEKDVPTNPTQCNIPKPDKEDENAVEGMILSNLLYLYKLQGSMDRPARDRNKLDYSFIPAYWPEDKQSIYKRLIDIINTRCIGNSGINPIIKTPRDVTLEKKLRESEQEKLENLLENFKIKRDELAKQKQVISEPIGEIPNLKPDGEDSMYSEKSGSREDETAFIAEYQEEKLKKSLLPKYVKEADNVAAFYGFSETCQNDVVPEQLTQEERKL